MFQKAKNDFVVCHSALTIDAKNCVNFLYLLLAHLQQLRDYTRKNSTSAAFEFLVFLDTWLGNIKGNFLTCVQCASSVKCGWEPDPPDAAQSHVSHPEQESEH